MINKHGHGEVYFGVDDDGLVVGQIITNSAIKDLSETIYRDIEPRIIPTLEVMNLDGKNVLKVAFYGSNKPYNAHGKFLIRVGTQNRKMSRDELIKLVQDNNYSFDLARAIGKSKKNSKNIKFSYIERLSFASRKQSIRILESQREKVIYNLSTFYKHIVRFFFNTKY